MAKQLIGRDNVEQYICHAEKKIYIDPLLFILSPGGKDHLREKGIAIVYGAQPNKAPNSVLQDAGADSQGELKTKIAQILEREYSITESSQIEVVIQKVLEKLSSQ